jgi:hypothetical protein
MPGAYSPHCDTCGKSRTILQLRDVLGTPSGVDIIQHAAELVLACDAAAFQAATNRLTERMTGQERSSGRRKL